MSQVAQMVNATTSVPCVYCSNRDKNTDPLFQFSWSGCMHDKGYLSKSTRFEVSVLSTALHVIKHKSDVDDAAPPAVRNLLDEEAEVAQDLEKTRNLKRKARDGKMRLMTLACDT
jgi:hypothetical protein